MKKLLIAILATVLGLCIFATLVFLLIPASQIRAVLEWAIEETLERDVSIGTLQLDRGLSTTVIIRDVQIANAEWSDTGPLAEIGTASVSVNLPAVLFAGPAIEAVSIRDAILRAEIDISGQTNWAVEADTGSADDTVGLLPAIADVTLENIKASYTVRADSGAELLHEAVVRRGSGSFGINDQAIFDAQGRYFDAPLSISFEADAADDASDDGRAYRFKADISGALDASITGVSELATELPPLTFDVTGPTLAVLNPFIPTPLPETPPFSVSGNLSVAEQIYEIVDLRGAIGDSDIAGNLKIDLSKARPAMEGDLKSSSLDFDDLAGLIGAEPDPTETANTQQKEAAKDQPLFPDEPLPVAELRRADLKLSFKASSVSSPLAQVESIEAVLTLEEGRLLLKPLALGVSSGRVFGEIAVNAREDTPSADLDLLIEDVLLQEFFAQSDFAQEMGGTISGKIYLLGVGSSLADMAATARGDGHLVLRNGEVSALLLEGAGVDIAEALGVLVGGDTSVPMSCAVAAFAAAEGIVELKRGVASTRDSNVIAKGRVNLQAQTLGLQLEARAKDFSLLDLDVPVYVEGPLVAPAVSVGGGDPLPLFEKGDTSTGTCPALIESVRELAPGQPR
ncbi:AsmA family protein [uncultured Roseobacter sp.]|uniref:AsmA family protein n=1 Tax=uncultured Roseobacter sp. TaxID=114847 RepID=UPI00263790B0|nr:AsmA family protein [uncultured Roseobacter sp.]